MGVAPWMAALVLNNLSSTITFRDAVVKIDFVFGNLCAGRWREHVEAQQVFFGSRNI
jgi:hypothetical protein